MTCINLIQASKRLDAETDVIGDKAIDWLDSVFPDAYTPDESPCRPAALLTISICASDRNRQSRFGSGCHDAALELVQNEAGSQIRAALHRVKDKDRRHSLRQALDYADRLRKLIR